MLAGDLVNRIQISNTKRPSIDETVEGLFI